MPSTVFLPRAYREFPGYEASYDQYIMVLRSPAAAASGESVYGPQLVKTLCIFIALEKDPAESERLMNLLNAVMREDSEEVRLRLRLLKKLYDPGGDDPVHK